MNPLSFRGTEQLLAACLERIDEWFEVGRVALNALRPARGASPTGATAPGQK